MPINAEKILLATADPSSLPDGPAIYVLWRDDVLIHAGFVTHNTQSLADRIRMYMSGPGDEPTPGGPTHFSFLLTENPVTLLGEILPLLDTGKTPS